MIKNIFNFIKSSYKTVNDYGFDNLDPHLVRYILERIWNNWKKH